LALEVAMGARDLQSLMSASTPKSSSLQPLRVAMVAGEVSGDLLASLLIKGLMTRFEPLSHFGIGAERMQALGFEARWPSEKLAVRGYFEVLRHYREIVAIRNAFKAQCLSERPDLFIGVDAPDFNLDLARALKERGIPTVQFVCPSVWAWRAKRILKIAQSVDHVLCLFPFEVDLLESHGIRATYVGHPLAQTIPMEPDRLQARQTLGLDESQGVVALMPGSRASEIKHLAFRFLQSAHIMLQSHPRLQFVLPTPKMFFNPLSAQVKSMGLESSVKVLEGESHACLASCDVALIASGTATLEAALFKRPMVIAYHMNALSWQIMKRQRLQPWVGLPNILCQDFVVPELLQSQATPDQLAQATLDWLNDPVKAQSLVHRFAQLHQTLMQDTPNLCVKAVKEVLQRNRPA
jgi:lipid-A-disaccharide synthase